MGARLRQEGELTLRKAINDVLDRLKQQESAHVLERNAFPGLEEMIQSVSAETGCDTWKRRNLVETLAHIIAQIRRELNTEIQARMIGHDQIVTISKESRESLERHIQDRAIVDDAFSRSLVQQEHVHMAQFSGIEGALATLRSDMEEELRCVKQGFESKFHDQRHIDGGVARHLKELSATLELEQKPWETLCSEVASSQRNLLDVRKSLMSAEKRMDEFAGASQKPETRNLGNLLSPSCLLFMGYSLPQLT